MPAPILPAGAVELRPSGPVDARLAAPPSKSVTNRALVCAALAEGTSELRSPLDSDDSQAMRAAVAAFGAEVSVAAGAWQIHGTGGRLRRPGRPVDARLSGTTMRFVTALATLAPGPATITGRPGLLARPVGPLVTALGTLGGELRDTGGFPPVVAAGGGLAGGQVVVPSAASSQFATAVLLVAPYARAAVRVRAAGVGAPAYLELTVQTLAGWGARVQRLAADTWQVAAGCPYRARTLTVEYDASAAAHLLALAVASGGRVTVTNARAGSRQPDARIGQALAAFGAALRRDGDELTVTGPPALAPVDLDLAAMPDQVTTLAALAALARGRSRLRGVAVTRGHESDRLAALAAELTKVGAEVVQRPDGLVITGTRRPRPARLATHGDHRLAMAFAALGLAVPGLVVEDPGCVAKTYPGFWADLAAAGVGWRPAPAARPHATPRLRSLPAP